MKRFLPLLFVLVFLPFLILPAQVTKRRERTADILHYRIELSFREEEGRVMGKTTVVFRPLRPDLSTLELDAAEMTIHGVASAAGKPLRYTYDSARLSIMLDRPLGYGEQAAVAIRYECVPKRGMYFIRPNETRPKDPRQIWTQGQRENNRYWFPCYDFPNDKATSEIIATVRGEYETVSNGILRSRRRNRDGTVTWQWMQEKPHSAYLIVFVAGEYRVTRRIWNGIPLLSYSYPTDDTADARRAYEATPRMMAFFSDYFGIPYPWPKYAQVPVAHFFFGGMENTSATVLSDARAVPDARRAKDDTPEALIAHELAHQWWGDLLTCIDWGEGWLNEGFATYFQQCWTQHAHGEDEFTYQRWNGIDRYLQWADVRGSVPLVEKQWGDRANIYSKGAAVLHMLRRILGEELFRRVLREYGSRFAFGCVETHDLMRTIEDVTGMDLRWFFAQWVFRGGYPAIDAEWFWNAGEGTASVRFSQLQEADSLKGYFRVPLDILFHTAKGDTLVRAMLDGPETTVHVHLEEKPRFVSVDHGSHICGRITLRQSIEECLAHLAENTDVVKRIEAGKFLVAHADAKDVRNALFEAARRDRFWGVRFHIAEQLSRLDPDSLAWAVELRTLWLDLVDDPHPRIRSTALAGLNHFHDRALLPVFERMLNDSSLYVEAEAIIGVCSLDTAKGRRAVLARLDEKRGSDVVITSVCLEWVSRLHIVEAADILLELASPGPSIDVRNGAARTLASLGTKRDELRRLLVRQLDEPDEDCRIQAAILLLDIFPQEGREAVRSRIARETDLDVREAMQRILVQMGRNGRP
ncbi:MAG: M1 family aminopeptidase [Bacteroidota bacterium]|nr:M1 family aminopeptidase [Bacteroidota bacterium]